MSRYRSLGLALAFLILAAGCTVARVPESQQQAADPPVLGAPPEAAGVAPGEVDLATARPLAAAFTPAPAGDGPPPDLTDVHFISEQAGFGVTDRGGVYQSTDGGTTWRQVFQLDDARLHQVAFTGATAGFAIGRRGCNPGPNCEGPAVLLSTADGGAHWQVIEPDGVGDRMVYAWPWLRFAFTAATVGYAVPDPDMGGGFGPLPEEMRGAVLATADGGRSWRPLPLPAGFYPAGGISFLTPETGFITASSKDGYHVLATRDGGRTWRTQYSTAQFPLHAIHFRNERQGWAGGGVNPKAERPPFQALLATGDGGTTWEVVYRQDERPGGSPIDGLHFTSPTIGWATTGVCTMGQNMPCGGRPLFTNDGGRTWTAAPEKVTRLSSVGASAWSVSGGAGSGKAFLRRTTDGGATWQNLWHPAAVAVNRIQFLNPQVGWIDTNVGFLKTTDGGGRWAPYPLGAPVGAPDRPVFTGPDSAFAWHDQELLRSSDGGRTWQPVPLPLPGGQPSYYRSGLAFAGPQHGWLSLPNLCRSTYCPNLLFTTTDGGSTWTRLEPGLPIPDAQLAFADARHGAAFGHARNRLFRTSDGGRDWKYEEFPRDLSVVSLSYAGPGHLWLVGTASGAEVGRPDGAVLHSTDGGERWIVYGADRFHPSQIQFVTPTQGWLVANWSQGGTGSLLVTRDGGRSWRQVWPAPP